MINGSESAIVEAFVIVSEVTNRQFLKGFEIMQLKIGDLVSGNQISTGRYLGEEKVQCEGQNSIFFKVYDSSQKIVHYLPEEQFKNIRKLPTKETVKRNMEILTQDSLIEVKEEEGSRYIFFTNKLKILWNS